MKYILISFAVSAWLATVPPGAQAQQLSGLIEEIESRTQFGIFTDARTEFNGESRAATFYSGHFVGHVTTNLSHRLQYFAEISVTPDNGHGGQTSLERSFFQFYFSDPFRLRLGRIHTPVSIWNSRYHHGQYLQTTVNRPEMVAYSTRLTPIHSVVAEVNGSFSAEAGALSYRIGGGSSEDHVHSDTVTPGSSANPAFYASLSLQPSRIIGLEVGGTAYREHLDHHNPRSEHHSHDVDRADILSAYISLDRYRWSMLAEIISTTHAHEEARFEGTYGYFVQAERQLWGKLDRSVLYGRYGHFKKNHNDPIFRADDCFNWHAITTGIRVNVAPRVALTTEVRLFGEEMSLPDRRLYFQISAAF